MEYFNNKELKFTLKRRQRMSLVKKKSIAKKAKGKIKNEMERLALQSLQQELDNEKSDEIVKELLHNMTLSEFIKTDSLDPDLPEDGNESINRKHTAIINQSDLLLDNESLIIPLNNAPLPEESVEILKNIMFEFQVLLYKMLVYS